MSFVNWTNYSENISSRNCFKVWYCFSGLNAYWSGVAFKDVFDTWDFLIFSMLEWRSWSWGFCGWNFYGVKYPWNKLSLSIWFWIICSADLSVSIFDFKNPLVSSYLYMFIGDRSLWDSSYLGKSSTSSFQFFYCIFWVFIYSFWSCFAMYSFRPNSALISSFDPSDSSSMLWMADCLLLFLSRASEFFDGLTALN